MKVLIVLFALTVFAVTIALYTDRVSAHEGEAHGPSFAIGQATDIVTLTAEASEVLGIKTAAAEERSISAVIPLAGTIQPAPDRDAILTSPVSGIVRAIPLEPGARVRAGALIADISSAEVGRARGEVTSASGDERAASANLERQKRLYERGIVSGREVEDARADLARARGAREGAGAAISAVNGGRVVSPIDGILVARFVTRGQAVEPGEEIAHVIDPSVVIVEGDVPEAQASGLRNGATIRIRIASMLDQEFIGTIHFVSPIVDEEKRTVHVYARFSNPDFHMKPGMFVEVFLQTDSAINAVAVPARAIIDEGLDRYVFVDQGNGRYSRVRVVLGPSDGFWTAVTGSIFPGDKVVVEGGRSLQMAALTGSSQSSPPPAAPQTEATKEAPAPVDESKPHSH